MKFNIVSWNMRGTGKYVIDKYSNMLSLYNNDEDCVNVFCIQECGSKNSFLINSSGYHETRRGIIISEFKIEILEELTNDIVRCKLTHTVNNRTIELWGIYGWRSTDVSKRCGTAILCDKYCTFGFVSIENRRPVMKLRISGNDLPIDIYSMHAIANNYAARREVNRFVHRYANNEGAYTVFAGDFNHSPCGMFAYNRDDVIAFTVSGGHPTQGDIIDNKRTRELDYFIFNMSAINCFKDVRVFVYSTFEYNNIQMLQRLYSDMIKNVNDSNSLHNEEEMDEEEFDSTSYNLSDHDILQLRFEI